MARMLRGIFVISVIICSLGLSQGAFKKWRKNTNFDNPSNWEGGHLPCSRDKAILPSSSSPIYIQTNMSVMELVLPNDGEIILGDFMSIGGGGDGQSSTSDEGCTGTDAHFMRTTPLDWFDPQNWCEISGPEGDCMSSPKERLDTERVPCTEDAVVFPPHSTFLINLGNNIDIFMGTLTLGNQQYTTGSFKSYINSREGSRQFKRRSGGTPTTINIQGTQCNDPKGCSCGNMNEEVKGRICRYEEARCSDVTCRTPLQPKGSCCPVCGATLELQTGLAFRFKNIEDLVSDKKMYFHSISSEVIQVVIYDNGDGEDAWRLAAEIKKALENDGKNENKYRITKVTMTGEPNAGPGKQTGGKTGGMSRGSIVGIVLSILLVIAVGGLAMYCLMDRSRCRRPKLEMPVSFKRFGRRDTTQMELTPSVPFKESVYFTDVTRGFDNPVYDTPDGAKKADEIKAPVGEGPAVIESSDVTFTRIPDDPDRKNGGFSNPLYSAQKSDGSPLSDGLPDSPLAQASGDMSPGSPPFSDGSRSFINPMYGTENVGPASVHLNPAFTDEGIETDSTV